MREDRPRLVGIFAKDRSQTFNAGALLCASVSMAEQGQATGHDEGWITAVTQSPALGHWIGLGFIAAGYEAWAGQTVLATDPTRADPIEVEIVSPHMFDPLEARMHG